jgi:hypothetical protein
MATYTTFPKGTTSFDSGTTPSVIAEYLATPGAPVSIATNSPSAGMTLIAVSSTVATWQTPSTFTTINDLRIEGNATNTATASGSLSIAMGRNTTAAGTNSITLGPNTVTGTNTSVVLGNSCSTVARSGAGNGDRCVIVGSNCVLSNSGGAGSGAIYDMNIVIGASNVSNYNSGNSRACNKNLLIGSDNTLTIAHNANFRRNFFITNNHAITTSAAHTQPIESNIIIGQGGSYTSDNTIALNNVIIGNNPTWTGCDGTVIIGSAVAAAAKTSVLVGTALSIPSNSVDFIGIGRTLTFLGSSDITGVVVAGTDNTIGNNIHCTNSVLYGKSAQVRGVGAVCIGNTTQVTNDGAIGIGNGATVSAVDSVAIGTSALVSATQAVGFGRLATCSGSAGVSIGNAANVSASASGGVCVGASTVVSQANGVALGNGAFVSGIGGTAVGFGATVTATSAVQLGNGTNSVVQSLKFRSFQLHDGNTVAAEQVVYKQTTGAYDSYLPYNLTLTSVGSFPGIQAGRFTDPNNTLFTDYDTQIGANSIARGTSVNLSYVDTKTSNAMNMLYRDGVNIIQGQPTNSLVAHGSEREWAANQILRFNMIRTEGDEWTFLPVVKFRLGEYVHMKFVLSGMRVADYNKGTGNWASSTYVSGSNWVVNPGEIGGAVFDGVGAAFARGVYDISFCAVDNNLGGGAVSAPTAFQVGSLGTTFPGYKFTTSPAIWDPAPGTITGTPVQTSTLPASSLVLFAGNGSTRSWSGFTSRTGGGFTAYATQLGAFFRGTPESNRNCTLGLWVKGKANHIVHWKVQAWCTITPFVDPFYGPTPNA